MKLRSTALLSSCVALALVAATAESMSSPNSTTTETAPFEGTFVEEGGDATEETWIDLGHDSKISTTSKKIQSIKEELSGGDDEEGTSSSSDDGQTNEPEPLTNLRGFSNGATSPGTSTPDAFSNQGNLVNLLDTQDQKKPKGKRAQQSDSSRRIVVMCDAEETTKECVQRLDALKGVKVIHKLKKLHRVAISVKESVLEDVIALGLEVHDDPIREPMNIPESLVVHDTIHRKLQSGNDDQVPYGVSMVKAPDVWAEFGTKGEGVRVCVMDSGIYRSHPDFVRSNLYGYSGTEAGVPQWFSDASGHGTHVSGTIAAADNERGVIGVAPGAEIYTVRVFDQNGFFYGSDVVAAAEACQDAGADIINMSLGGPQYDRDEKEIFEELFSQGILAVAASGNSGDTDYGFPASYDVVMSVGAVDSRSRLASFSTRNDRVDISAPGVDVLSTYPFGGGYASQSGTSMSTPHVSGVAALLKSIKPSASASEIMQVLIDTSDDAGRNGYDRGYGHGIVNALNAARQLDASNPSPTRPPNPSPTQAPYSRPTRQPTPSPTPAPASVTIRINFRTDGYAYETSYYLRRQSDGEKLWDVDGRDLRNYQAYYQQSKVNPNDCYRFEIFDSFGDGIFGTGIELIWDGRTAYSGGNFGSGGYLDFGNGC